jgi:hypothetical protein
MDLVGAAEQFPQPHRLYVFAGADRHPRAGVDGISGAVGGG